MSRVSRNWAAPEGNPRGRCAWSGTASVLFVLAALLAGCSDQGPAPAPSPSPVLVTAPSDNRDLRGGGTGQAHLHDYWGGQLTLVVVQASQEEMGPGFYGGEPFAVATFLPPPGAVVPQGADAVNVTFTWVEAPGDLHGEAEVWVKTAADANLSKVAPAAAGVPIRVESSNERNDLPHQVLSAWAFELRMAVDPQTGVLRFKGTVTLTVEAHRGLPIPLFPGHPDRWDGLDSVPLIDEGRDLLYAEDPVDHRCDGFSCPQTEVPENGRIVPYDAAYVEAILQVDEASAAQVGLSYHGASSRELERVEPDETAPGSQRFILEVGDTGDGPYAAQSQWAFRPYIKGPVPDGATAASYHLTVVAHK